MHRLIISAPFGNYLSWPQVTSTIGTFTLRRRAGLLGRLWRAALTLRYWPRCQLWVNKMALPNPGIESAIVDATGKIISIHGFNTNEWSQLLVHATARRPEAIELNVSCPNVHGGLDGINAVCDAIACYGGDVRLIAKLAPLRWLSTAEQLYNAGVRIFHLCNTIPTPGGGISGKPLKQYSMWAVQEVKQKWGDDVTVIGGGGITSMMDMFDYRAIGADHIAIGSMLFNPFNWPIVTSMSGWLEAVHRVRQMDAACTEADNGAPDGHTAGVDGRP